MEIVPEYNEDIASIGLSNSKQMTIGNAAHLFSLLSKNLYSDPDLAAIREILTNAWDAHIASGITDGLVRFSVGIEDCEDIMADLEQALDKI